MENFTPLASLSGGILIGLSAAAMLLFNGAMLAGMFLFKLVHINSSTAPKEKTDVCISHNTAKL